MSRKHPVPHEEQLRLVYECRNSGLSDSQWCCQHGIATSTFSNWVIRNKKRGDIIPDPVSAEEYWPDAKPDIVQVNLVSDAAYVEKKLPFQLPGNCPTVRLRKYRQMPHQLSSSLVSLCSRLNCVEPNFGSPMISIPICWPRQSRFCEVPYVSRYHQGRSYFHNYRIY